jgi:hypothetical protein
MQHLAIQKRNELNPTIWNVLRLMGTAWVWAGRDSCCRLYQAMISIVKVQISAAQEWKRPCYRPGSNTAGLHGRPARSRQRQKTVFFPRATFLARRALHHVCQVAWVVENVVSGERKN